MKARASTLLDESALHQYDLCLEAFQQKLSNIKSKIDAIPLDALNTALALIPGILPFSPYPTSERIEEEYISDYFSDQYCAVASRKLLQVKAAAASRKEPAPALPQEQVFLDSLIDKKINAALNKRKNPGPKNRKGHAGPQKPAVVQTQKQSGPKGRKKTPKPKTQSNKPVRSSSKAASEKSKIKARKPHSRNSKQN